MMQIEFSKNDSDHQTCTKTNNLLKLEGLISQSSKIFFQDPVFSESIDRS